MDKFKVSRIDMFRQLKTEVRGSNQHLLIGIDVAKDDHVAFMGDANGHTLLKRFSFQNNLLGFRDLVLKAESVKRRHHLSKTVFGLEPTASYHKPLGEYLIHQGLEVVLTSSNAVKKNRELLDGRWDKHDAKDSANVADLISQGKCLYYDHPEEKIAHLQRLMSLRRKLKKQEHGLRMRIRNHLIAQYFPELDVHFNELETECLAIVKHRIDPQKIVELELNDFMALILRKQPSLSLRDKINTIWEKALYSIGCSCSAAVQFEAKTLVTLLEQTRSAQKETQLQVQKLCESFEEYDCLLSIPGFGPIVSAMTLSAIGDPFRFSNQRQVLKMAGLDLSASRSGKYANRQIPVISKKGKAELRYGLYQAALIASSRNKIFKIYFAEKLKGRLKEKGIKTKRRVKLAAKLLVIAWALMKKKERFDPECITRQIDRDELRF